MIKRGAQMIADPDDSESILTPPSFHSGPPEDPPLELLSDLIERLNEEFGADFSDAQLKKIQKYRKLTCGKY